jgi:hypothetical protein
VPEQLQITAVVKAITATSSGQQSLDFQQVHELKVISHALL